MKSVKFVKNISQGSPFYKSGEPLDSMLSDVKEGEESEATMFSWIQKF